MFWTTAAMPNIPTRKDRATIENLTMRNHKEEKSGGIKGDKIRDSKSNTTNNENPQVKNIRRDEKKAKASTKRLYLSKFPLAILLAASPMRCMDYILSFKYNPATLIVQILQPPATTHGCPI
jgi:hypothetical protein